MVYGRCLSLSVPAPVVSSLSEYGSVRPVYHVGVRPVYHVGVPRRCTTGEYTECTDWRCTTGEYTECTEVQRCTAGVTHGGTAAQEQPRSRPWLLRLRQWRRGHLLAAYGVMRLREHHMANRCQPEPCRRNQEVLINTLWYCRLVSGWRTAAWYSSPTGHAGGYHCIPCRCTAPPPQAQTVAGRRLGLPPAHPRIDVQQALGHPVPYGTLRYLSIRLAEPVPYGTTYLIIYLAEPVPYGTTYLIYNCI